MPPNDPTPDHADCPPVAPDGAWDLVLPTAAGSASPPFVYVLERFKLSRRILDELPFAKILDDYQHAIQTCAPGWERLMVSGSVTGDPYRFVQLWRAPSPLPLVETLLALRARGGPGYRAFLANLLELEHHVLSPMSYDPLVGGRRRAEGPPPRSAVLLVDHVAVRPGALARLACLKERFFIPRVARMGWQLVMAGTMATGRPGTLVHVWQLPDAGSLLQTMRTLAENETYRTELGPCIEREEQELYEPLLSD